MNFLELRAKGYDRLSGTGIEVGGFEHPAVLPRAKRIIRCDRITTEEAKDLFREVDASHLPVVDVCLDLDRDGLASFQDGTMDFVVCCHVLEHLKNPLKALEEFFRVLKVGGLAALAVPDKRFTFDQQRPVTAWEALEAIHRNKVNHPRPADYYDVIKYNHAGLLHLPAAELEPHLQGLMERREHLNVWDTESFMSFLDRGLGLLRQRHRVVFESRGDENRFEYFCIVEKLGTPSLLSRLFGARPGAG